jgi:hypothetical protein
MRRCFLTPSLIASAFALVLPSLASAAVITTNYGDFVASTVTYQAVTEASGSGNPFGTPTYVGDDTIQFLPTNFIANPDLPALSEIVDSQIRFTIVAKSNQHIPVLNLSETGAVTLLGDVSSGGYATAGVGMAIFYHIRAIDGVAINGPSGSLNMIFTPSGGIYNLANGALDNQQWSGQLTIDFDAILASKSLAGHATTVEVTFDNTLSAANYNGAFALIEKQFVEISVPESSTALLVLSGTSVLASIGWRRRLRRQ